MICQNPQEYTFSLLCYYCENVVFFYVQVKCTHLKTFVIMACQQFWLNGGLDERTQQQ